ncbi:hypothetical protein SOVF_084210 [Spinacia oleracea]|nr:hypothetical protein SOVF_084210 [Spinacia oleracea]
MADCKVYVRQQRRRLSKVKEEDDRLSSLPDAIITDILSRLPIDSAAATSVLSHRWRRLWTGRSESITIIDHILRQLKSRKLRDFDVDLSGLSDFPNKGKFEVWFREVCSRNVENITINNNVFDFNFRVPAFVFNSQSLVTLKLLGLLKFKWPQIGDLSFELPNLKILHLRELGVVPLWLGTLIRSCPLLEDLFLVFGLYHLPSPHSVLNIIAANLKSLSIRMESVANKTKTRYTTISIDAPKLANLDIRDCNSFYCFLQNPTKLGKARVDLKSWIIPHLECDNRESEGEDEDSEEEDEDSEEEDEESEVDEQDGSLRGRKKYLRQMTKFVGGMSNVSNLELMIRSRTNILAHLNSEILPIFSNLVCLKLNCLKNLLHFLHFFPNLEHLEVYLWHNDLQMEQRNWCTPDSVPDCLVNKLKTIQISGIHGIGNDLKLLAYIMRNAIVLEKLFLHVCRKDSFSVSDEREEAYAVWKEGQFCRSLFRLPRRSSTCEVEVRCKSVTAFGNALQDGYLTCRMYVGK